MRQTMELQLSQTNDLLRAQMIQCPTEAAGSNCNPMYIDGAEQFPTPLGGPGVGYAGEPLPYGSTEG